MTYPPEIFLRILRPIIRMCLNSGIRIQELLPVIKKAFILESKLILDKDNMPATVSKLSVMTGLQRPDVSKQLDDEAVPAKPSAIAQIVSVWLNSSRFLNKKGNPRVLSPEGRDSEFARLVASVSKELNAYAVLFEMERAGLIERTDDGVRLIGSAHIVSKDKKEGFRLLGSDINDLTNAVNENLEADSPRHLHLRLAYDNIPPQDIPTVETEVLRLGQRFILDAQKIVAKYDRDTSDRPSNGAEASTQGRARFSLTAFSYSEEGASPCAALQL